PHGDRCVRPRPACAGTAFSRIFRRTSPSHGSLSPGREARTMSPDFIYTMKDLRKVVPPKREILKGIWLSFFDGAKIGVLGLNGAGKSSLLRIMAGEDPDFIGEAFIGKGYTVGFLPQEPQLDAAKSVIQVVEEGVAAKKAILDRFNEVSAGFAEPMDDGAMQKLLD